MSNFRSINRNFMVQLTDIARYQLLCTYLVEGIPKTFPKQRVLKHYGDVIMDAIASQITSLIIVYSTVYSDVDQRKHQSSASLAFVWGIHRGPVNSPHKWPVTRKMSPFDDVIMDKIAGIIAAVPRRTSLSGVPDYFGRNKISSGGDLSHYSSASLY